MFVWIEISGFVYWFATYDCVLQWFWFCLLDVVVLVLMVISFEVIVLIAFFV